MRIVRYLVFVGLVVKAAVVGFWCWASVAQAEKTGKAEAPAVADGTVPQDLLARSRGFRDLLDAVRKRTAALDEREQALQARAATLDALEKTVSSEIARLESAGGAARPAAVDPGGPGGAAPAAAGGGPAVTKIYENMKAEEAAPIIDKLDDATAKAILGRMKEKQIGAILAAMNRDRAVALTKALAGS